MSIPVWVMRALTALLLLVHGFLAAWGVIGLAEWLLPTVPWSRVSNPELPRGILLLQWLLLLLAAGTFLLGFWRRWRRTPVAMAVVYALMAGLCAVQTFFFLTHESRFREMAIEYLEYAVILALLFRTDYFKRRFLAGISSSS